MIYIADSYLEQLIKEDIPYIDLTSHLLEIDDVPATINYYTREDCILCGSEEAARIFKMLGAQVGEFSPSGASLKAGEYFFSAQGPAGALHAGWKVCLNIFDHYSAVATKTKMLVDTAHAIAPHLPILTTRKAIPGTKPLMIKAIITGGAVPHRLGISETVLIFSNHVALTGGFEGLLEKLPEILAANCEKKVLVEAGPEQALILADYDIDGIQLDKATPEILVELVPKLRAKNPQLTLIAAGGINENNVSEYAATGVDGLVTTAVYTAKPLDMSAKIAPINS